MPGTHKQAHISEFRALWFVEIAATTGSSSMVGFWNFSVVSFGGILVGACVGRWNENKHSTLSGWRGTIKYDLTLRRLPP